MLDKAKNLINHTLFPSRFNLEQPQPIGLENRGENNCFLNCAVRAL